MAHAVMSGLPHARAEASTRSVLGAAREASRHGRSVWQGTPATMRRPQAGSPADQVAASASSSPSDSARARRPTDLVLVFVSLITIGLALLFDEGTSAFEAALTSFVTALPGLLGWFWESCDALVGVWAVVLVGAALFAHGRRSLFRDQPPRGRLGVPRPAPS